MRILIAALALSAAIASPAAADDDDNRCGTTDQSTWLSIADISAKAEANGLKVRKVETDDGCYEVYGIDAKGQRVETYMHPVSGDVVKTKIDD